MPCLLIWPPGEMYVFLLSNEMEYSLLRPFSLDLRRQRVGCDVA